MATISRGWSGDCIETRIADDAGMLDVGFDASAPEVMAGFSRGDY